ncbi:PAS domain S-box-containing protein [Halarchaeum rubridurum]|uniref:histidine kinase n=1 Tax=Halarchaeum rubridurum TaxID=489911 RepID=A0A830FTY7_9EURY|nr:PAS domain-containing protein [Halarchaeum rubridurum]MBP1954865.1 PAS domain S-box-containing protein [Halarchaeum rubridurum]GGM60363.1 hypothetical protein GCM10009017_08150 [Halarchaeum rubridurum]
MFPAAPIRVLYVDARSEVAETVAERLEREDERFAVETVPNASTALAVLAEHAVDCVVSEYDLPECDGLDFLDAVRADHPDLPFVLFTETGSEEIASRAITAGVTDYLRNEDGDEQYVLLANRVGHAVERRRATVERRENERRFEAVFEDPEMLVGLLAPDGTVQRVNGTAMSFVDAERDDVLGAPFWETAWWDPDDAARVRSWVERAAAGEYVSFDADGTDARGEPYSVSGTIRPVTVEGEVVSLIASAREITERRRQRRELEAEQAFVDQALDTLTDIFYVLDTSGRVERWNERLGEVTGYDADDLSGTLATAFFDDEDAARVAAAIEETFRTGEATVRADVVTVDGEAIPHELTGARLTDADGELVGLVGVGRDLTERRAREREIERMRDLLERTERIADVGGWEIDPETREVFRTEGVRDLYGVETADTVPLEAALDVYHEADRETVAEAVEAALSDGEAFDVEVRCVRPDGETRWVRLQGVPETADGTVVALRGAIQDRTAQRRYERELERQNARLDEFASVVSHDLRNPLQVADGYLDLAREECDSDHLDTVSGAHDRMSALIDDLLTLARDGEDATAREPISLGGFVRECWEHVDTADATLDAAVTGTVRADRGRLQQLVENLFRNAVEHGGESVTVTVGRLDDGFYVADDGTGIPPDVRAEIGEDGQVSTSRGPGLGLRIVGQVVAAHDWAFEATESEAGGARFEITGVEFDDAAADDGATDDAAVDD